MGNAEMFDVASLHDVRVIGYGSSSVVLSHGFGCNQKVWNPIADRLVSSFRVVLFDLMGSNSHNVRFFNAAKYRSLDAYAADLIAVLETAGGGPVSFVGHSVSGMLGVLAAIARPDLFRKLVLIAPSPCYMNLDGYRGGFDRAELQQLFDAALESYEAWTNRFAPFAVSREPRNPATQEFARGLLAMPPDVGLSMLVAIFTSDLRDRLPLVRVPTVVIQPASDPAVPAEVTAFIRNGIPGCAVEFIDTEGHLPHLTDPETVLGALRRHLP